MLHLPHRAQERKEGNLPRAIILPWYVAEDETSLNLEIMQAGTPDDLAQANRKLVAPPKTPSGLTPATATLRLRQLPSRHLQENKKD